MYTDELSVPLSLESSKLRASRYMLQAGYCNCMARYDCYFSAAGTNDIVRKLLSRFCIVGGAVSSVNLECVVWNCYDWNRFFEQS